jgi:hypothetical protein
MVFVSSKDVSLRKLQRNPTDNLREVVVGEKVDIPLSITSTCHTIGYAVFTASTHL